MTNKKDSLKSQPKRPNQNGQVENDLFKMAPWSSQTKAITAFDQFSQSKNPCFLVVNIMLFHKEPFAPKTSRMKRIGRW